jgi:hypothetical protein
MTMLRPLRSKNEVPITGVVPKSTNGTPKGTSKCPQEFVRHHEARELVKQREISELTMAISGGEIYIRWMNALKRCV